MKKYLSLLYLFLFLCCSFHMRAETKNYGMARQDLIQISYEVAEELFEENTDMWKTLLVGTLAVETDLGQFKGNSIYGVAQMRNSGFQFVQRELRNKEEEQTVFEKLSGIKYSEVSLKMLEYDCRLSILYMAYYYKFLLKGKMDFNTKEEAAKIWKKYYNTKAGKGRPEDFLKAYQKHERYLEEFENKKTE